MGRLSWRFNIIGENQTAYKYVIWLDASEPASVLAGFSQFARDILQISIPGSGGTEEGTLKLVISTLQACDEAWLLVFDHFDQPHRFEFNLMTYLPPSDKGDVIVTSSRRSEELKSSIDSHIGDADKLEPSEAYTLVFASERKILRVLKDVNCQMDSEHDKFTEQATINDGQATSPSTDRPDELVKWRLLELFNYHALALDTIAELLRRNWTVEGILAYWEESQSKERQPNDEFAVFQTTITVWRASKSNIFEVEALMHVLAVFAHIVDHPIEPELFALYGKKCIKSGEIRQWMRILITEDHQTFKWDAESVSKSMKELSNYAFIRERRSPKAYAMHPLMEIFIKNQLSEEQLDRAQMDVLCMIFTLLDVDSNTIG